jgi:hypothetical protein
MRKRRKSIDMQREKELEQRRVLNLFLNNKTVISSLPINLTKFIVQEYPLGKYSAPDFCLSGEGYRVAIEIFQAVGLESRIAAQWDDVKWLEQELRSRLPHSTGWSIHLSSLPSRKKKCRQLNAFLNALIRKLNKLSSESPVDASRSWYPKDLLLQKHRVVFYKDEHQQRLYIIFGYNMNINYEHMKIISNVRKHLKTFNEVAEQFTNLILLIHDIDGLIIEDLAEFAPKLDQEIAQLDKICPKAISILLGIYAVHDPVLVITTGPRLPSVARVWP